MKNNLLSLIVGGCLLAGRTEDEAVHRAFVMRDLSPGGSADLLAVALFIAEWEPRLLRLPERDA